MGKKKVQNKNDPEAIKEAGNKAFMAKNFNEAIKLYTVAIEITMDKPSPIYYANRANAHLELFNIEECIADCNQAISIDSEYTKSYYRKAKALQYKQNYKEAMETIQIVIQKEPNNHDILQFQKILQEEIDQENRLPPEHPERKKFQNMMDWMKIEGATFQKLKLCYYTVNYRGVHTVADIKIGEEILFVPRKLLITLEMAFATPIGKLMYEKGLRQRLISPKHNFLGAFILQERRKENSPFQQYLDILPKDVTEFPVFFTNEEKQWLTGSRFLIQISDKIEEIKKDYDLVCEEVPEFAQFPLKEYTEIRMITASRIFGINIDGVKTDAFVPYADMLNHKRPRETTWYYSDEKQGFVIEACEDISRGSPVYDSYGKKCNSRFFLNYGFINLNNDGNEVNLKISLDPKLEGYEVKMKLLNNRYPFQWFKVVANLREDVMMDLLSWSRYVTFDDEPTHLYLARNEKINEIKKKRELNKKQSDSDIDSDDHLDLQDVFKGHNIKPFSIKNETNAWLMIKWTAECAYDQYPNQLDEDLKILKQDDEQKFLTLNQRNCVLFRQGEKEILIFLIEVADRMIKWLQMSSKEIQSELKTFKYWTLVDSYLTQYLYPLLQGNAF